MFFVLTSGMPAGGARSWGRARIETSATNRGWRRRAPRGARSWGRARIETASISSQVPLSWVAPGLGAGRGLKHVAAQLDPGGPQVAPGLGAGRGLKLGGLAGRAVRPGPVAPGLGAGRGLKPAALGQGLDGPQVAPGLGAGR